MASDTITVAVPQALYQRLERLAHLSGRTLESLVAQTLAANIPPIPDDLPAHTREALRSLEHDSDTDLSEANGRCGYCHTPEILIGMPMEFEHIYPEALGGSTGGPQPRL